MTAVFSVKNTDIHDIVFIGSTTTVPYNRDIFDALAKLSGINFTIPDNAEYATAVGAALAFLQDKKHIFLFIDSYIWYVLISVFASLRS
jgi:type II pantothenate kinase